MIILPVSFPTHRVFIIRKAPVEKGTTLMYTSVQDKGEDTIMGRANVTKTERINLRLNEVTKRRIERAASFEGKTVSGFIVSSALSYAEKTIQLHETMVLNRRDAMRFFDVLSNPPAMNDKLRSAMGEHGKRVVSR